MKQMNAKGLGSKQQRGTSLVVQRLRLCTCSLGDTGALPSQGAKIPHATWHSQKQK